MLSPRFLLRVEIDRSAGAAVSGFQPRAAQILGLRLGLDLLAPGRDVRMGRAVFSSANLKAVPTQIFSILNEAHKNRLEEMYAGMALVLQAMRAFPEEGYQHRLLPRAGMAL